MAELRTADIQQFLTTNEEVQKMVADRLGISDGMLEIDDLDSEERKYITETQAKGKKPKKWKRLMKYGVGSKTDKDNCSPLCELGIDLTGGVDLTGGIVRIFQLEEESICVLTVEKDGKIIFIEDVGD